MLSGDCNVCINGKMPSYSATCVECGLSRKNYKPITNADRIRSMTDEELATWIGKITAGGYGMCAPGHYDCAGNDSCAPCWLDWLREEAGQDAGDGP